LIPPGNNTTFTLKVENVPSEAERQTVTFSFSVQPPENGNANDITFDPTQPSCSAGNGQTSCNVTVTVSASGNATPGDYQITITGTAPNGKGGSVSKSTIFTLTVGGRCVKRSGCFTDDDCKRNQQQTFTCEDENLGTCSLSGSTCPPDGNCPAIDCGSCVWDPKKGYYCNNHSGCSASGCEIGEGCGIQSQTCQGRSPGTCTTPQPNVCVNDDDCPATHYCEYPE